MRGFHLEASIDSEGIPWTDQKLFGQPTASVSPTIEVEHIARYLTRLCLLRPLFFPLAVIVEMVARMICAVCGSFLSATAREGHRSRFLSAVPGAPTSRGLLFQCAV